MRKGEQARDEMVQDVNFQKYNEILLDYVEVRRWEEYLIGYQMWKMSGKHIQI